MRPEDFIAANAALAAPPLVRAMFGLPQPGRPARRKTKESRTSKKKEVSA